MRRLAPLALAALPLPALAQGGTDCGGIAAVGEWMGGAETASDPLASDGPIDAEGLVPIAGHLVRMFTLSQDADIRVEVAGTTDGDPYFTVVDGAGNEVAADDDSGGNLAARADVTLPAGTYCIASRSYSSGLTPVAIRVGLPFHDPLTTGGSGGAAPATGPMGPGCGAPEVAMIGDGLGAAALGPGVTLTASATEAPGRGFVLSESVPLTITATADAADPVIRLLDASGDQLAENDDFDGLNSRIDMLAPLAPGAYCVEVEDLNGSADPIAVTLLAYDAEADRRAQIDRAELAPGPQDMVAMVELGAVQTSVIHDVQAGGPAQWLRFSLPEGGVLVAEAVASGVDPTIRLFDRVGRVVGENDDGPEGLDSLLALRVSAGDYMLAVQLVGDGTSGPVRILLERYVPAQ